MLKSEPERKADSRPNSFVSPVSIVDIFFKAKALERRGVDVIHFDAGEPDFDPPEEVVNATKKAIDTGKARYTEPGGIPEVRQAIADHVNSKYHLNVSTKQVMIAPGGRMALYLAYLALPEQTRIGIFSPDWPAYRDLTTFMNIPTTFFETTLEKSWNPNVDEIRKSSINSIVFNYPNNPTGKILEEDLFEDLIRVVHDNKLMLLSDEVYSDYVFDSSRPFKSVLQTEDTNYVFTTSLSKSYAMTGFRAGYLVAEEKTISKLEKITSLILTSVPEFVQYGVIEAFNCKDYVKDKVQLIKRRRDVAADALRKELGAEVYLPDGSMYIFPRLRPESSGFTSERFALDLLDKMHVSVTPGTAFGPSYSKYIRMTLLQSEERIKEGIERMKGLLP